MERIPGMTEGAISAVLIMMKKQELFGIFRLQFHIDLGKFTVIFNARQLLR